MCIEIKISYSLYKKYSDLLDIKFKRRDNLSKERAKLLLKRPSNKEEQRIVNNDLNIVNDQITYLSGEIEILRKFLHEIIAENKEGGGTV